MQTIADLLNQFRTPIGVINITFAGENIAYRIHHDVRVLSDCARIIKIASRFLHLNALYLTAESLSLNQFPNIPHLQIFEHSQAKPGYETRIL